MIFYTSSLTFYVEYETNHIGVFLKYHFPTNPTTQETPKDENNIILNIKVRMMLRPTLNKKIGSIPLFIMIIHTKNKNRPIIVFSKVKGTL